MDDEAGFGARFLKTVQQDWAEITGQPALQEGTQPSGPAQMSMLACVLGVALGVCVGFFFLHHLLLVLPVAIVGAVLLYFLRTGHHSLDLVIATVKGWFAAPRVNAQ
jgi:Flp pilus assembly protein TadB